MLIRALPLILLGLWVTSVASSSFNYDRGEVAEGELRLWLEMVDV